MFEVISYAKLSNGQFLLMAKNKLSNLHPFATWMADSPDGNGPSGRYWGHYCETEQDALQSFHERLGRHVKG